MTVSFDDLQRHDNVSSFFQISIPCLLSSPATLLLVEVKGRWTEAEFEVGQPRGADVNRRGHSSRAQPDEEHADPTGPSVMRALE